jgi:tol-pal system protein YbgF
VTAAAARRASVPLLAALLLSGCVATQRDVLDLENQTDELKREVLELKKTITSLQGNQADLSVSMKQLHTDITTYTETIKDNQDQMRRLGSKLDDMSAAVEQRVAAIGTTLTNQQAKSLEEQKTAAARENPSDLFNTADVRLGVKDYALASKGFEEYLNKYPKGALIDVATYKLGQAYFGLKLWEKAGRQFAVVLDKYPRSEMTASSRLMYALSLVRMKKNLDEARQYLESVTNDYPSSPEAKAAAAELKKLSAKKG